MSIPAESITDCDTKQFFNRANLYFTITYTNIMITICKNLRTWKKEAKHVTYYLNSLVNLEFWYLNNVAKNYTKFLNNMASKLRI